MKDTLRMYAMHADISTTTDDQVRSLFVKALVLLTRDTPEMAKMWLGIAKDRNWLTEEELDDCEHILRST